MSETLKKSTVLITGGTGTFGHVFLNRCLKIGVKEIRIFSRDEKKQYDMAQRLKECKNVKFYIGDVRDKSTIDQAMAGVDYVFHAAAMKQVPSCEMFPMEAVKTNIIGSDNVLTSAIQNKVKKVVCLSTDKAVYPTSAMGMSKAYMEKLALQKAKDQNTTEICITRFGNLVASRGSVVPLFIEQAHNGLPITITDPDMTRFVMTAQEAAELVEKAFSVGMNGEILVKESPSCTIRDLATALCKFLRLPDDYPIKVIGARPGEKKHEALLTEEEARNARVEDGYIVVPTGRALKNSMSAEYDSGKADKMDEDGVLRLLKSIFTEGAME